MQGQISELEFVNILETGTRSTTEFMARLTDYHGTAVETEYILTADIARAFLDKGHDVRVEYLNRLLVNKLVQRSSWTPKRVLGAQRTDVVVTFSDIIPRAIVEVKIGVGGSLAPIEDDLQKIAATIDGMKVNYAAQVRAASVFQVHVLGRRNEIDTVRLKKRIQDIDQSLTVNLAAFAPTWPDFTFALVPLQGQSEGFVATSIEHDESGGAELGATGHATRYYAIIIKSIRTIPSGASLRTRLHE